MGNPMNASLLSDSGDNPDAIEVEAFPGAEASTEPTSPSHLERFAAGGVILVGVLGIAGHLLDFHLLKAFLPWVREEIPLSTSIALVLLGGGIAGGIAVKDAGPKGKAHFLLLACAGGIGLYTILQHFVLSGIEIYRPLIEDFAMIPMAFLTAVQILACSVGVLLFQRYRPHWQASLLLSIVAIWLVATIVFALLGYALKLPVLYSYLQSIPTIVAFSLVSLVLLRATLRNQGLLSPLISGNPRIRFFAWAGILASSGILVAGIIVIKLFDTLVGHGIETTAIDLLYVGFELGTTTLAILVLLLTGRMLFFYEKSLDTAAALQTLNEELDMRVRERTAQLEKVSRQKSRVLSMVSHDLKTPLAAVSRFAEILTRDADNLSSSQKEMIDYIREGLHQMRILVTDVLDRARIEAGKIVVIPQKIAIEAFVENLLPTIRVLADDRNVTIISEVQPDLEIVADPVLLRQILLNLLSNAIKYNRPGGHVYLRVHDEREQGVVFSVRDTGIGIPDWVLRDVESGNVLIEIQDTGIGIPADRMPKLFSDFYRIGAGLNTVDGTGLGLAATQRLVELHGGTITVKSMEDQGSIFSVLLPKAGPPPAQERFSSKDALAKPITGE